MGTPYYAHAGRYIGGEVLDLSSRDPEPQDPRTPGSPRPPGPQIRGTLQIQDPSRSGATEIQDLMVQSSESSTS